MKNFFFLLFMSLTALTQAQKNLTFTIEPDGNVIIIKGFKCHNECIGHAALDPQDYPTGSIDELLVKPNHRNQGFGKELLQKAIQFFQDRNYAHVYLQVSPFSARPRLEQKELRRFYAKYGFRSINDLEMIKNLYSNTICNRIIKKHPYITAIVAAPALSILRYKSGFIRNQLKK